MAQITYRANLSARSFPFISQNWGRTVIVPQYDNTFNRQVTSQADADSDVGIPQIYYCHNVMPHQQGFQSVGYTNINTTLSTSSFVGVESISTSVNGREYFLLQDLGIVKIDNTGATVVLTGGPGSGISPYRTSVAQVSGDVYVYFRGDTVQRSYRYNPDTDALVAATLTGLPVVDAITSAFGYLIAWTTSTLYWSSTIDPTDFTPSLTTGAGSGLIEAAKGDIVTIVPHLQGLIIYTTGNIIAAIYSGNPRYPFTFREIAGSGGLLNSSQVTFDANSGNHYAYTTSGLQLVNTTQAQTILPELTDFISGNLFEDYDESSGVFTSTTLTAPMVKLLNMVADRYLVISYGTTSYTHALVYDLTTKRWGKLKHSHKLCFDYSIPTTGISEIPRQSIAFINPATGISTVDLTNPSSTAVGVILLGKYQFVRQRLLQLDEICIENIPAGTTPTVQVLTALDGKNPSTVVPSLISSSGLFRKYGCRAIGINHSILIKGSFTLTSMELIFNIHGKR